MNIQRPIAHTNFTTVQASRGLAAIAVLLFHTEMTLALPKYFGVSTFSFLRAGDSGVHFFFVLSGFIITMAHWSDIGRETLPTSFIWKRFRRVYLPLWPVLTILLLAVMFIPSLASTGAPGLWQILAAYAALPQLEQPLLAVEWTLSHEIFFYTLFAIMLWRAKVGAPLMVIWFVASICGGFLVVDFPLSFALSPYNILFLFGIAAAGAIGFLQPWRPGIQLASGLILFFATWAWTLSGAVRTNAIVPILLFGAGAALIVVGITTLESLGKLRSAKSLKFLGDASYSIYLVHFPAVSLLAKIAMKGETLIHLDLRVWFALVAIGALLIGILAHLALEKPLMRLVPSKL